MLIEKLFERLEEIMEKRKCEGDFYAVGRYIEGDRDAGEELFASAFPIVQGFVYKSTKSDLCFSSTDKEDIVSESLVRSVDKLHLYNGSCAFSTFAVGCAKHVILEFRKKKGKEQAKIISIDELINTSSVEKFGENPIKIVIDREKSEAIIKAIEMLSPDYKQLITLRLLNEMPFKQIVELSGKSEDAVDSMFRRAIKSFKNNFNNIYNNATDFSTFGH
ncbi:MAG: sigma-70 family RNA polymerase sigma factor [Christensenellaceae bacterium]